MLGQNILLASHDSIGARAAEKFTFEHCTADNHITHLIVVPDFWRGMLGDDWLNTSKTRRHFTNYLESTLQDEINQHIERLQQLAKKHKVKYQTIVKTGDPMQCLITTIEELDNIDLIILGSQRAKGIGGFRSKMLKYKLFRQLKTPILVVPFPNE